MGLCPCVPRDVPVLGVAVTADSRNANSVGNHARPTVVAAERAGPSLAEGPCLETSVQATWTGRAQVDQAVEGAAVKPTWTYSPRTRATPSCSSVEQSSSSSSSTEPPAPCTSDQPDSKVSSGAWEGVGSTPTNLPAGVGGRDCHPPQLSPLPPLISCPFSEPGFLFFFLTLVRLPSWEWEVTAGLRPE